MKYPNLTSATIIKDSISSRGHRMTTVKMVFPRYILAELNTHRVFGRNSASSRAIPFRKMVRSALDYPFIPMAFQKDHTGMQGTEYLDPTIPVSLPDFLSVLSSVFKYNDDREIDNDIFKLLDEIYQTNREVEKTLEEWWLYCRDKAVKCAILMASLGVTKQLCNRILEPFIYHTALITSTEWDNFFELRTPKYTWEYEEGVIVEKSKEDFLKVFSNRYPTNGEKDLHDMDLVTNDLDANNSINWLLMNKGMGEIHIMDLAEKTWDAMNESTPDILKDGEWHIPFGDNMDDVRLDYITSDFTKSWSRDNNTEKMLEAKIKVATARAARISYESLGDNPIIDYEKDIKLHDDLLRDKHMSPFEHIGRAMTDKEYKSYVRGKLVFEDTDKTVALDSDGYLNIDLEGLGWSRNLHGFIQYREIVEQNG